ncbi:DNA cytosine methyltransferase [uncultured Photobacterium sp.]|uniref:DNA cytosine methyltransferase n=1 Tax=uncultured Photobacterium sp. TaxID=173973 RepID=UPI00262980E7|nr:DNA cytosine methyltransferase [uncultured Photobacterium sp.]
MATLINTKLGENRGKRRVWLEGGCLSKEGIEPGMAYEVIFSDSDVRVKITENGSFRVSKRSMNNRTKPLIELRFDELADIFAGVETLRVAIRGHELVVTAHEQECRRIERERRLKEKLQKGEALSVMSLFTGGAVLDTAVHDGLALSGVSSYCSVAIETEQKYLDSAYYNSKIFTEDSVLINSPIEQVYVGDKTPYVEIAVAGIPCTGASRSGKAKNKLKFAEEHTAAGAMFFNFLQFMKATNAAVIVVENVPDYRNTSSYAVIQSVLNQLGYVIQDRVLNGNDYGCLERRERMAMVAVSKGLAGSMDMDNILPLRQKEPQLSDILESIPDNDPRWKTYDYLADKAIKDKAAGKGFARQLLKGSEGHCGTIGRDYMKARSTEPFIVHPTDPSLSRLLTVKEHCAVKGVPGYLVKNLSDTVAHQILGQGVCYPVFKAVGKSMGEALLACCDLQTVTVSAVKHPAPDWIGGDDVEPALAVYQPETGEVRLVDERYQLLVLHDEQEQTNGNGVIMLHDKDNVDDVSYMPISQVIDEYRVIGAVAA